MAGSLSALVVLRNSQSTVESLTDQLLEILSDIVPAFEIVLIDEASTDATFEVAEQLQQVYPQVRAIRRQERGFAAALRKGLSASSGRSILILHNVAAVSPNLVVMLWKAVLRYPEAVIVGNVRRELSAGSHDVVPAVQMVSRQMLQQVFTQLDDTSAEDQPWKLLLARQGYRWHVVGGAGRSDTPHHASVHPAAPVPAPLAGPETGEQFPNLAISGT